MSNENTNMRWIFRPTDDQVSRGQEIMGSNRYRNFSELLRQALTIGFDQIQKDILINGNGGEGEIVSEEKGKKTRGR